MFTQENYNVIVKVLNNGAPALAGELVSALNSLVKERDELRKELCNLKSSEQCTEQKEVE